MLIYFIPGKPQDSTLEVFFFFKIMTYKRKNTMENNTPPISKLNRILRLISLVLAMPIVIIGAYLFITIDTGPALSFVFLVMSAIPFIFLITADKSNYLIIRLKEYQAIEIITQTIGIEEIVIAKSSFSVQQRIFNITKYKFEWITINKNLTEKEAIADVNNKFITLGEPVTVVIYKKP